MQRNIVEGGNAGKALANPRHRQPRRRRVRRLLVRRHGLLKLAVAELLIGRFGLRFPFHRQHRHKGLRQQGFAAKVAGHVFRRQGTDQTRLLRDVGDKRALFSAMISSVSGPASIAVTFTSLSRPVSSSACTTPMAGWSQHAT